MSFGRIIWTLAILALAVVAVLAQLDRTSRQVPALAALVPGAFSGFAAERLAEQAILAEDTAEAERQTLRLIRARPLPAENLSLLSLAAALGGDQSRALAALEQASQRGWREPVSQLAAGQAALLEGNYPAAAQRISALLSSGSQTDQAYAMLSRLLAAPEGRAAFAKLMAAPGHWQRNFITPAGAIIAPDDLAQTLALAKSAGAEIPCPALATLAQNYRRKGHDAAANRFWPGDCPA